VQPSGARSWVTWIRSGGKTRRVTLGRLDSLTLAEARDAVLQQRATPGAPPAPTGRGITFKTLSARFMAAKAGVYQPRTLDCMAVYLDTQLLPALGHRPVHRITTPELADWFYRYSQSRPGGANQALLHFITILNWGKNTNQLPADLPNPAAAIRRNRRGSPGRMLNSAALARLARVLSTAPARTQDAAQAIELTLLTGCRSGEILRLPWKEVKKDRLELTRTKTGPRTVFLNDEALALLDQRRVMATSDFVFPSPFDATRPQSSITRAWHGFKTTAGLPETLRLHDLRHTYASHAILSGESLYVTGKLLGHRNPRSTDRYAHLDATNLTMAADEIAGKIEVLMGGS
jgi:integrase